MGVLVIQLTYTPSSYLFSITTSVTLSLLSIISITVTIPHCLRALSASYPEPTGEPYRTLNLWYRLLLQAAYDASHWIVPSLIYLLITLFFFLVFPVLNSSTTWSPIIRRTSSSSRVHKPETSEYRIPLVISLLFNRTTFPSSFFSMFRCCCPCPAKSIHWS